MMAHTATAPIKITFTRIEKPVEPRKVIVINNKDKVKIDDAYKEFFASLFKIKDKDVQRRVLQAVNGQDLTCANCANKIQSKGLSNEKESGNTRSFSVLTQTYDKDFEFLEKINSSVKPNGTLKTTAANNNKNGECYLLNKIQLGRARRKVGPYAVKAKKEKCVTPSNKNKISKPKIKTDSPPIQSKLRNYSITEKLLFDNLDIDHSMSPHGFFNFKSNEQPTKFNDFFFLSTMEEEIRTASVCNEEGLYTIHIATIKGDLFKLRRLMVIYKYNKWDVNVRSEDGKKETPLHFAMSCTDNARNNEIIDMLYEKGADVLAVNDVGNTVLHLAAETIDDYGIIKKLLSRISLDDLSRKNDKSQTILHVAAANKNRTFVKLILHFIDRMLSITSIGKDIPFTDAKKHFEELDTLHLSFVKNFINEKFKKPSVNRTKAKIVNEQDGRTGKTAVFLSLANNDQSICLMLLAHYADTRIEDFSNTSCAFYSTEILRNRILAQAIYNADAMHNAVVVKTLKETERHRLHESRKRAQVVGENDNDNDGGDIMSKVAKVLM